MAKQILGLSEVSGSLVVYENVEDVGFEEVVEVKMADGSLRTGRVVEIEGDKIIVQVFEGSNRRLQKCPEVPPCGAVA